MRKPVMLHVTTANEDLTDKANFVIVEVNQDIRARILRLSHAVFEVGARRISDDFALSFWSSMDDDVPDTDNDDMRIVLDAMKEPFNADGVMVHVSPSEVWFTAYPKHGSANHQMTSCRMSLSELDSEQPYIAIE